MAYQDPKVDALVKARPAPEPRHIHSAAMEAMRSGKAMTFDSISKRAEELQRESNKVK